MKIQSWTNPKSCQVLNLDLSLRNIGWARFSYGELDDWGCIENPQPKGRGQERAATEISRFSETFEEIRKLAAVVDLVNCEIIYTSQSNSGAVAMGFCWATVSWLRTFRSTNIIFPKQVKQLVKPRGKVSKDEVARYVKGKHSQILFTQLVDHITDAIAVHHAYAKEYQDHQAKLL